MAIAELTGQRTTQGGPAATSITFTYPVAPTPGNLIVACFSYRLSGTTISGTPTGWTNIERRNGNINTVLAWKIAGASEPIGHTWTLSASVKSAGGATEYSGIDADSVRSQLRGHCPASLLDKCPGCVPGQDGHSYKGSVRP